MRASLSREMKLWELPADAVYGFPLCDANTLRAAGRFLGKYNHLVNLDLRLVRIVEDTQPKSALRVTATEGRQPFLAPVYLLFDETVWCRQRIQLCPVVSQKKLVSAGLDLLSPLREPGSLLCVSEHYFIVQAIHFFKHLVSEVGRGPEHPMSPFLLKWDDVVREYAGEINEAIIWGERFLDRSVETGDLRVVPEIW